MNFTWMDLVRYLEVTALVMGASLLLARVLPMPDARQRLRFLYLTLFLCLIAPLCAVRHEREVVSLGTLPVRYDSIEVVDTGEGTIYIERPLVNLWKQVGPVPRLMLFLAALRILWLCVGLIRLSLYRRRATLLMPLPPHLREVRARQRVDAHLYVSKEVNGPVTFGFLSPTVLLPEYFGQIGEAQQSAAVCHELAHVRRNDAVTVFGEEVLRSVLWFHPLVWWLLDRIQLCREQVVDEETIEITEDRATYLETLLAFAQRTAIPDLAPATPFLKRNHLVERMNSIAKEANVPGRIQRLNTFALYTLMPCALALGIWLMPLRGQPVLVHDTPGVVVDTPYLILHRGPIEFRSDVAKGAVVVTVTVDSAGEVTNARVVSGPEAMGPIVLRSVKGWHFDTEHGVPPKQFDVAVRFEPTAGAALPATLDTPRNEGPNPASQQFVVKVVDLSEIDEPRRDRIRRALGMLDGVAFEGKSITRAQLDEKIQAVVQADRSLGAQVKVGGKQPPEVEVVFHDWTKSADPAGYASKPLRVTKVDATALPEALRSRAVQLSGISVGDTISQLEVLDKLKTLNSAEPSVQFAWSTPVDGTVEIYLMPRGSRSPALSLNMPSAIHVTSVDASALPEPLRQRALEKLNLHEGDSPTPEDLFARQAALREVDRHLVLQRSPAGSADPRSDQWAFQILLATAPDSAPAPTVQFPPDAPRPTYTVTPVYPPMALKARIQGTVRFMMIIGADGTVQNLQLVSGHPLMVPSSTDALKQFRFVPTGAEVKTTASVMFSLSQ